MKYIIRFLILSLLFGGLQARAMDQLDKYRSADHVVVNLKIAEWPSIIRNGASEHSFDGRKGVLFSKQSGDQAVHELEFQYFKSDKRGPRPLVIVIPPIIGSTPIDGIVTETLAMNDINVIVPVFGSVLKTAHSLDETNRTIERYLIALRLLIKTVVNDPTQEIDPKKVGVYGMSLGAVLSAVLVGLSEDVTHAFILAGGGNLSEISQNSTQSIVVNFKKNMIEAGSANEENWQESVKKTFSFEPIDYAKYAVGKKIFMLMCESDIVIPYKNQLELWNALGKPPSSSSTFHSHVGTIIKWVIKSRYELIDFMKE